MIDKNIDHKRASYAYTCIKDIEVNHPDSEKKYRSAVMSSGVLIQRSGLMQTLSFYISKKNSKPENGPTHYELLADHILHWMYEDYVNENRLEFYRKLLQLSDENVQNILCKTQEVKLLSVWLKRFADTMLKGEHT